MVGGCIGLVAYLIVCRPGLQTAPQPTHPKMEALMSAGDLDDPQWDAKPRRKLFGTPVRWVLTSEGWELSNGPESDKTLRLVWDKKDGSVQLWDGHNWNLIQKGAKWVGVVNDLFDVSTKEDSESAVIVRDRPPVEGADMLADEAGEPKIVYFLPRLDGSGRVVWPLD